MKYHNKYFPKVRKKSIPLITTDTLPEIFINLESLQKNPQQFYHARIMLQMLLRRQYDMVFKISDLKGPSFYFLIFKIQFKIKPNSQVYSED